MQPIKNSVVREQIRLKNEMSAKSKEKRLLDQFESYKSDRLLKCDKLVTAINQKKDQQINQVNAKLKSDTQDIDNTIRSLNKTPEPNFNVILMLALFIISSIAGCAVASSTNSFKESLTFGLIGGSVVAVIYVIIHFMCVSAANGNNQSVDNQIISLEDKKTKLAETAKLEIQRLLKQATADSEKANIDVKRDIEKEERRVKSEIFKIYSACDQQTVKEINAYNSEMNAFAGNLMNNLDKLSPMVDHVISIFKGMDSQVKHEPIINLDLKFEVSKTELIFDLYNQKQEPRSKNYRNYQYDNSQSEDQNYNFFKEGFRNLAKDYECEGLAKALVLLTKAKMEKIYPTMMVSFDHLDSLVIMHFKDINPNGRIL